MPVLMKMMTSETSIKIQTHVVSTLINFSKGLLNDEEEEEETNGSQIMEIYSQSLFENLVMLLKKGMDSQYEPLQEEVMNLLSVVATLIDKEFSKFYN
jgi:hypothetical protein